MKLKKIMCVTVLSIALAIGGALPASATTNISDEPVFGIQDMPSKIYKSNVSRSFSKNLSIPPASITHTEYHSGVRYTGSLTRVSYADAVERWLAAYSGYIYRR